VERTAERDAARHKAELAEAMVSLHTGLAAEVRNLFPADEDDNIVVRVSTLVAAHDAARAEAALLREALQDYGEHGRDCIRARFEAGRPTADGGYESCYAGVWYESAPVDRTPACTCGFSAALARTAPDAVHACMVIPALDLSGGAK
jgi:hypothetical protein